MQSLFVVLHCFLHWIPLLTTYSFDLTVYQTKGRVLGQDYDSISIEIGAVLCKIGAGFHVLCPEGPCCCRAGNKLASEWPARFQAQIRTVPTHGSRCLEFCTEPPCSDWSEVFCPMEHGTLVRAWATIYIFTMLTFLVKHKVQVLLFLPWQSYVVKWKGC